MRVVQILIDRVCVRRIDRHDPRVGDRDRRPDRSSFEACWLSAVVRRVDPAVRPSVTRRRKYMSDHKAL
jgi:hypothetical protein